MRDDYFDQNVNLNKNYKKSKGGISIPALLISFIAVAVFSILIYEKRDDILDFIGIDGNGEIEGSASLSGFNIGDKITSTGIITPDENITNYTHILDTELGKIGLKSSTLNLNNYKGEVYVEGIIDRFYQGLPIISVSSIFENNFEEDTSNIDSLNGNETYLGNAGLFLDSDFFDKYALISEGDGTIKLKELTTDKITLIQYFKCDVNNQEHNCEKLTKEIGGNTTQKITDIYGNIYYRRSGSESWFVSNNLFGYYISDLQDTSLKELSNNLTIINKTYAEKNISNNISKVCVTGDFSMKNVKNSDIKLQNNKLMYILEGDDGNNNKINCNLEINPTSTYKAILTDINVQESSTKDNNTQNNESNNGNQNKTTRNTNVEQFPINLEKKLTFTSSRGHSFIFPSSNLSYRGFNVDEDFGQAGIYCYSAMNIVQYTNSGEIETNPSVVIYECSMKNGFNITDQSLIYRPVGDKHFIIKINDPARVNFANNIEIQA